MILILTFLLNEFLLFNNNINFQKTLNHNKKKLIDFLFFVDIIKQTSLLC